MKIGIDCRFYLESGIGRYIRNLVLNLQALDQVNDYLLFFDKRGIVNFKESENFKKILIDIPWYGLSEQLKMPGVLNKYKLDLIHFPHFNVPILYKGKFVVTIHDLIHQHQKGRDFTNQFLVNYLLKRFAYKKVFAKALHKSLRIIVPSNNIKNQLIDEWKVSSDKILVTYEAVDDDIIDLGKKISSSEVDKVLNKFNIDNPYFFYNGSAHPHKNLKILIEAFEQFLKNNPKYNLVLAGRENKFWDKVKGSIVSTKIKFIGFVSDIELVALYKRALSYIQPSFEEGFGISPLEAMACSCPVISSDIPTSREIYGDSCLYFNPFKSSDLRLQMKKMMDKRVKDILVKKGIMQVQKYSWKRLATDTLAIYQSAN